MSYAEHFAMLSGAPRLKQLYADLRAAELDREAPRLAVPESKYREMCGETWRKGGVLYELVDIRDASTTPPAQPTRLDHVIGTFKLKTGEPAYFVAQP